MNLLFYLGHPAQYHFFKFTIRKLEENGHHIKLLIKTKDILENLLKEDGLEYENIQVTPRKNKKYSIVLASIQRFFKVYSIAKRFKADILIGTDSSIAQAAWLLRKYAITTLEDDYDVIRNLARLTYPFTSSIVVPEPCSVGKWKEKKIPYYGYMKLAYLHPDYFVPSKEVVHSYGIKNDYVLIRLAKLAAHHDVGIKGLNLSLVQSIIRVIQERGLDVYISSEVELDPSLTQYQLKIRYSDIHHIMAFASMLISDSQSMSVESSMLGVPSLRFSDFAGRISVLEELEDKYGLTFGIETSEPDKLLDRVSSLISLPNIRCEFQKRREKMLSDKINVTKFMTWFIEIYPGSHNCIKENPDYQLRFR